MFMAYEGLSCLKFVKNDNNDDCEVMLSAAQAVEDTGQVVQWVEPGALEDVPVSKNSIYVLETFDVPIFLRLSGKTRVIGPMVVLAHLKYNIPLPVSRQPTFTMTMHGVTACCTQIGERENRTKLIELVKLMGGHTSGNFTRHVTHLIAGQVGSTKYQVAQSLNTPVLLPSWVHDTWEEGRVNLLKATTEEIMAAHRCPPLTGCVVSSTGFSLEGRGRLKQLVEGNGGEYSSNLIRDSCTHLIVGDITSKKYQYGRDWKIHCVSEDWLNCSIKCGYCLEEEKYPVKDGPGDTRGEGEGEEGVTENKPQENIVSRKRSAVDQKEQEVVVKKTKVSHVIDLDTDEVEEDDLLTQYQTEMLFTKAEDRSSTNGLFNGLRFSINPCLSGDARAAVARETERRGASIVSLSVSCDYHVTPLSRPQSVPAECGEVVTLIWLERSLAGDALLDPTSHFLFRPLSIALPTRTLEGCVITISQFDGLEREHLSCLCRSIGAIVQDCFARYPSKGLLATTHLVLREAEGHKYHSAISWGVNAVSDEWLFACVSAQRIVPSNQYLIRPRPSPKPDTPPTDDHAHKMDVTNEGEESQLGKSFHPNYDLQDVSLNVTQTAGPDTQIAGVFELNINKALETVNDAEKEAADNSNVLEGVVIVVHKKLSSRKGECHQLVTSMGGKWRATYDKQCTHYICQGRVSDIARDKQLQSAKSSGCVLVSYHWLLMCSQTVTRQDEGLYPCNYNPNRAIPILSQRLSNTRQKEATVDTDIEREEEIDQSENAPPTSVPSLPHDDSLKKQCDEIREMIERNGKKDWNKRSSRTRDSGQSPSKSRSPDVKRRAAWKFNRRGDSPMDGLHMSDSQLLTVTYEDPEDRLQQEKLLAQMRNRQSLLSSPIGQSVPGKDLTTPINHFKDILQQNCDTSMVVNRPHPSSNRLTRSMARGDNLPSTPVAPPTRLPIVTSNKESKIGESLYSDEASKAEIQPKLVFLLSSLNIQEKADYGSLIQDLGGEYYESDHFVASCTHLVVGKASRTEKYLAACSSGKWILNRTYLEACRSECTFVEEHDYEWGVHLIGSGKASALDNAPKKWREKLSGKKGGAFEGWHVLLCVEPSKQNGLKRLLEAGGASVVPPTRIKSDFTAKKFTHAFLNPSSRDPPVAVKSLVDCGVHCMRPDYIAEYLQRETLPTTQQFVLPEALKLLKET